MLKRRYNKIVILSFTVIASVAAHLWAIYFLQDLNIDFYSPKQAYMENHLAQLQNDTQINKKEEAKKRNEQLNQAFNELIRHAQESKNLKYDISQIRIDYVQPQESALDIPLETPTIPDAPSFQSLDTAAFAESEPLLNQLILSSANTDNTSLLQPNKIDILFPNDQGIANELMRATQIAQGSVSADMQEALDLTHTIKAGQIEHSSVHGNFNQNRSGLIDQGEPDAHLQTDPSLMALTDAAASQQEMLQKLSAAPLSQTSNDKPSPLRAAKTTVAPVPVRTSSICATLSPSQQAAIFRSMWNIPKTAMPPDTCFVWS